MATLKECIRIIRDQKIELPIVYIMACQIGPFMNRFFKETHKLGGKVYLNPDGAAVIIGTSGRGGNLADMHVAGDLQEIRGKKM